MNPETIVGKKPFKPQESWKDAAENIKSVGDIYNVETADPEDLGVLTDCLIARSFFLPRELLTMEPLKVSQLVIMCQDDYLSFWQEIVSASMSNYYLHYEADRQLTLAAKNVGVSARWWQGNLHIVCKVWYGGNTNTDSATDANAAHRLRKLREFCHLK